MARQLCCRGMCKNLLRSDGQQRSYRKAKFPSNVNCGQKTVSETGPWTTSWIIQCKIFHAIVFVSFCWFCVFSCLWISLTNVYLLLMDCSTVIGIIKLTDIKPQQTQSSTNHVDGSLDKLCTCRWNQIRYAIIKTSLNANGVTLQLSHVTAELGI